MTTTILPPFPIFTDLDGEPLEAGYIWIGVENLPPQTNPTTVYWDEALTQPAAQPIRTSGGYPVNNGTPAALYAPGAYSILVQDSRGTLVYSALSETTLTSSANVTFLQAGTGAVTRTALSKMQDIASAKDFGAVGDGVANDTVALQNFFTACVAGKRGYIGAGTYMVDEGQIVIQPASDIDSTGFYVETAGYFSTVIKGRGTSQAPLITIQNLTQSSGVGKFLKGGYLGALGFDGSAQPGGWTASHALSLRGVDGWEFGYLYGVSLKGDLLRIPQNLYAGVNPDPYHVAFCIFHGLQSNFGSGWVLNNDNFVGFTSNEIFNVVCYGASTGNGAIRTCGAGNIYKKISVGTCWGWAIQIYDGSTAGRMSREEFQIAELDDPEYGIWVFNADQAIFDQIRIVHRYHAGIGYWPREALRLSDATNPLVSNVTFDITHRIEVGGALGDLGGFLRCQGSNAVVACHIVYKIVDNASLGITNATLLSGANINALADIRFLSNIQGDRTVIYDSQAKPFAYVTLNSAASIPSGGFGSIGNKITTSGEIYDRRNNFSTVNSSYTVPATGIYVFTCSFSVSGVAAAVRFRFGLFNETSSALVKYFSQETTSTSKLVFTGAGMVSLTAGDVVSLNADSNRGIATTVDTAVSLEAENSWSIQLLESAR